MKICKIISYPTGGLEFQFFFFHDRLEPIDSRDRYTREENNFFKSSSATSFADLCFFHDMSDIYFFSL